MHDVIYSYSAILQIDQVITLVENNILRTIRQKEGMLLNSFFLCSPDRVDHDRCAKQFSKYSIDHLDHFEQLLIQKISLTG